MGRFWFICCVHQALYLCVAIYFSLYKIVLIENKNKNKQKKTTSIPSKTVGDTQNSSLPTNIKSFGKMEKVLGSCLKNGRKLVEKNWILCSVESWWKWKLCLLLLLQKRNFFANPIFNYFVCITYIQRNCIHTQTSTCYSMIYYNVYHHMGFPNDSVGKESACNPGNTGDVGSIHGSRRSSGVGNVNPCQDSCLKNPMDRVT